MMCNIGNEMDAASGGTLRLPPSNARVLDLCMAPGGYSATVLERSPYAVVCAYTLPRYLGGHEIIHPQDSRLRVAFGDITMLHTEFGVTEIPREYRDLSQFSDSRPWYGKKFDLVFCDGQALRTHEPHIADYRRQVEATRLTVSQLILAMQRIERGGTLIMLLHNIAACRNIKLLHVFDNIAEVQLFKPERSHSKRSSFYLIAKNVQPGHPKAVAAVNEWKRVWKELTFPTTNQDREKTLSDVSSKPELAAETSDLLESFGERVIELGEPIWEIQRNALATATWGFTKKKKKVRPGQMEPEEGSAATTEGAQVASPDGSGEEVNDGGDPDHSVAANGSGKSLNATVKGRGDSEEMARAMGGLVIDG